MSWPTEATSTALVEPKSQSAGEPKTWRRKGRTRPLAANIVSRRILLTSSNFPRWAGDSTTPFVLHLAQDLQSLGWCVDVLAPHAPGAASQEYLDNVLVERFRYCWPERHETVCYQGGALINLRKNRANFAKLPLLVLAEWSAIARRLASGRYNLLNSHWILPQGFTGVLSAKPFRVPHVITVHGGDVFALKHPMLTRAKAFGLRHADAVTVNSTATGRSVEEITPGLARLKHIPMGVSEDPPDSSRVSKLRRTYRRGDGPLVVFLGRLVEEKGAGDVIDAVSILAGRHPDVTALIVGDGQDRAALEQLSQRLNLEDRVTFVGWVESRQVADYLAAGDVFVGPSRRSKEGWVEAQGLTLAEAMLAGTPVVATDSGGIPDTVRHEETGLLVEEAAAQQIADSISKLIENPGLAKRLVSEARTFARANLTRQCSAERFSNLFSQLCCRSPAARC
jgi:phosphatidyl-myo-inositol dimannoside synthase